MAILRAKEIKKLSSSDIEEKVKDLRMELVKNRVSASKGGKLKIREIKRTIARLLTIDRLNSGKKTPKKVLKTPEKQPVKKVVKKSVKK